MLKFREEKKKPVPGKEFPEGKMMNENLGKGVPPSAVSFHFTACSKVVDYDQVSGSEQRLETVPAKSSPQRCCWRK